MIFACRLREDLEHRARNGDAAALRLLFSALPADLPATIRLAARDQAIRRMADRLRAALPHAGKRRLAQILADAGAQLAAGHANLRALEFLDEAERQWLRAEISAALAYLPHRQKDGRRWPKRRQIETIIS